MPHIMRPSLGPLAQYGRLPWFISLVNPFSRFRKTRGLYHYAQKGKTAWLEIFVDRILEGWDRGFWLKLPLVRDFLLAPVLFHEIGHHIHATVRPEFQEREDVADRWQVKLETIYYRKERPYIRLFSKFAKPFHPAIKRILAADVARH